MRCPELCGVCDQTAWSAMELHSCHQSSPTLSSQLPNGATLCSTKRRPAGTERAHISCFQSGRELRPPLDLAPSSALSVVKTTTMTLVH